MQNNEIPSQMYAMWRIQLAEQWPLLLLSWTIAAAVKPALKICWGAPTTNPPTQHGNEMKEQTVVSICGLTCCLLRQLLLAWAPYNIHRWQLGFKVMPPMEHRLWHKPVCIGTMGKQPNKNQLLWLHTFLEKKAIYKTFYLVCQHNLAVIWNLIWIQNMTGIGEIKKRETIELNQETCQFLNWLVW